ncbi:MAG: DUF6439 family protein [Synechococcus sp.]|nr:DUF6439 family protein [Synechococcus sp.]
MEQVSTAALEQAQELHRSLSISDRDWHRLKADRHRRAAEQLSAALQLLLQQGASGDAAVLELLDSAGRWLRREQRDPGCPHATKPQAG